MSKFYSLMNLQNATFVDLIPFSLKIFGILNRGVKISETASVIPRLIIIVCVMFTRLYFIDPRLKISILSSLLIVLVMFAYYLTGFYLKTVE